MSDSILIGIVSVIVLGIGAQWIAWRIRIPSILLLLVVGFLAGPVTGLLEPASLQGDWLFAFVSLSIGIILFEGGLSLRISELREIGAAVLNLITIGVLITWALAGLAAYYIIGFSLPMATLTGAIVTVTGPTVVIPLLRHVRPKGRISKIAKWEGITIDPVGAVLAVLVLETILLLQSGAEGGNLNEALWHAVEGLLLTIATSVGIGVIGAGFLVLVLYRRLVPDYLRSSVALMVVVSTFALSNSLQEESGLLEVTLMGIILANQRFVDVRRIIEFKEDLQVLLIASLFILLSARLELSALDLITWRSFAFLAVLIIVVRPLAVFISSQPTKIEMKEKVFLSWLAPRGIVAAAVASLFAFRLESIFPEESAELVPLIFLVIVGTVAIYGLTISPLARYLGLADPNPQGVVLLGGHPWARQLAKAIKGMDFKVLVIDSNTRNVRFATQMGLDAVVANALSEAVLDELDLSGLGKLMAVTPNDEINSLATLNFLEIFESTAVYQLAGGMDKDEQHHVASHLRGSVLFKGQNFTSLTEQYNDGGRIITVVVTSDESFESLTEEYEGKEFVLVIGRGSDLLVNSEDRPLTPIVGDKTVLFVPSVEKAQARVEGAAFDRLLMKAHVLDLEKDADFSDIALQASALLATRLPISADKLGTGFLEGARFGAAPIANGFAIPHFRLPGIPEPELVFVRCKEGAHIDFEEGFEVDEHIDTVVNGFFFLVSPQGAAGMHLRVLAQLAGRIDDKDFMNAWMTAPDHQRIKETLISPDRRISLDLGQSDEMGMVGTRIEDVSLPQDAFIALVGRNGELIHADLGMTLRDNDRVTIIGEPETIARMAQKLS